MNTAKFGLIALLCLIASPAWAGFRQNEQTGKKDYTGIDVQSTDCSAQTVEGRICWDTDNDTLCVGTGAACTTISGSSTNSFETITPPAGTSPVADSATDTLTLTETSFLTLTGTAATDTIDITQVTTDLGTDGLIAANAVALGTDTTNAYVTDLTAGTYIDVSGGGAETATVTVDVDATEIEAVTFGAGGNASNLWTVDLSGTDPTALWGSDALTLNTEDVLIQGPAPNWVLDPDSGNGIGGHCEAGTSVCFIGRQGGSPLITFSATDLIALSSLMNVASCDVKAYLSGTLYCGTDATAAAGAGDVTDVGDCTTGACFTAAGTGTTLTPPAGTLTIAGDQVLSDATPSLLFDPSGAGDSFHLGADTASIFLLSNATDSVRYFEIAASHLLTIGDGTSKVRDLYTDFASGSVPFIRSDGRLAQDNTGLFWDASTRRLSLGGDSSPDGFLDITEVGTNPTSSILISLSQSPTYTTGTNHDMKGIKLTVSNGGASADLNEVWGLDYEIDPNGAIVDDVVGERISVTPSATSVTTQHGLRVISYALTGTYGEMAAAQYETYPSVGATDVAEAYGLKIIMDSDTVVDFLAALYIEELSLGGEATQAYGIYQEGTRLNWLEGDLLVTSSGPNLGVQATGGTAFNLHGGSNHAWFSDGNEDVRYWVADGAANRLLLGDLGAPLTSLDVLTDGTGDGEVRLPQDSIGVNELDTADSPADAEALTYQASSGRMVWATGGSGDDLDFERAWPAASLEPLEAADSIPPLTKTTGTNLDEFTLSYDAATDEGRKVTFVVPNDVASGTVTFSIYWTSLTATSGAVVWDVRSTATGADSEAWDAALTTDTATCTVDGTVREFDICQITETVANLGWAAGDRITLMLYRDANNASDDMAGDAELHMLHMRIPVS